MRATLCVLFAVVCVYADKKEDRRTKPFVADALGNTLPPPSNVPASVGSPVNLVTPDRYEFYTFDESGELVKRLMTLEEIQAIVAAGEDSDGLVTFANDNQPTIAFNFSQPPFTKVHSVVTNVQNVLKAQMEAHKNKPQIQPTLDTPDVSDSWSLILPSIFGNTGVDIVPDKPTNGFTPETDTLESILNIDDEENSLSKEGGVEISSTTVSENDDKLFDDAKSTTTTTETPTTTTTIKTTTTTKRPTTSTTVKVTTTTTTKKPSTTPKLRTTTTSTTTTTKVPTTTTTKAPKTTTTIKPTTSKPTTTKPVVKITPRTTTTSRPITTTVKASTTSSAAPLLQSWTEISTPAFEKLSTFVHSSTPNYAPQKTTFQGLVSSKLPLVYASTTKRSPSTTTKIPSRTTTTASPKLSTTITTTFKPVTEVVTSTTVKSSDEEKINSTTVTTQSVSPSTTVSSTELTSSFSGMKDTDPIIPMFDVAQSISQIASDLGNNYQPIPTTSNLLDTTKVNTMDMESKEILDMDIPSGNDNQQNDSNDKIDNFVKITTIDPHPNEGAKIKEIEHVKIENNNFKENLDAVTETNKEKNVESSTKAEIKATTDLSTTENSDLSSSLPDNSDVTTIDPILSESMGDLLSQVVNEKPQDIVNIDNNAFKESNEIPTAEDVKETTTEFYETTSEYPSTAKSDITTTTTKSTTSNNDQKSSDPKVSDLPTSTVKTVLKDNISEKNQNNTQEVNKNDEFIQISVLKVEDSPTISNTKKETISNEINSNHNNIKIENKNKGATNETNSDVRKSDSEKIPEDNNVKKDKKPITTTTPSHKLETTTKPPSSSNANEKIEQPSPVKINSLDENPNQKDKIVEPLPKVEEFKKKIQKVNIDDEELNNKRNNSWKLVPTVTPPKANDSQKDKIKSENSNEDNKNVILEFSNENQGLEVTTKALGEDIAQFTELCNELAFRYWNVLVENIDKRRSFVLSPYSITSMLAMMFMGARGATSGEMNEILKLDDMVTFNPHFTLKNISDSIETTPESGIIVSAFIRELYSDRNKGKILTFYKERAQHFYSGHVEEINFKLISDIIRRRTNLLVKRYTWGKITEYMKTNSIAMNPPLAAFSANIFETDCTGSSVDGRNGEMYFVVSPNIRQRRLVPVPAVVFKSGFLAGYDPVLDATAAALGNTNSIVSTIFLMPGQQGNIVHSDDLEKLEQRLLEANPTKPVWSRVLRTLLPRAGLELQIPRFSHKSVFNVSSSLKEMGLKDLFDATHADLGGLNGPSKDLYLSDMVQMTSFVTCGEGLVIGDQHHVEEYPDSMNLAHRRTYRWLNDWDEPRDYQRAFHDPNDVVEAMHLPLHLRPRQARLPTRSVQPARLKFDRPFLFFVRHNPSGMILYVGRYNPRLLP